LHADVAYLDDEYLETEEARSSAVYMDDEFEEGPLYRSIGDVMSYQSSLPYDPAFQHVHNAPKPSDSNSPGERLELYMKILEPVRDIPMDLVLGNSADLCDKFDQLNQKHNTAPPLMRRQKSFRPMHLLETQEQTLINQNMAGFRMQLGSVMVC